MSWHNLYQRLKQTLGNRLQKVTWLINHLRYLIMKESFSTTYTKRVVWPLQMRKPPLPETSFILWVMWTSQKNSGEHSAPLSNRTKVFECFRSHATTQDVSNSLNTARMLFRLNDIWKLFLGTGVGTGSGVKFLTNCTRHVLSSDVKNVTGNTKEDSNAVHRELETVHTHTEHSIYVL